MICRMCGSDRGYITDELPDSGRLTPYKLLRCEPCRHEVAKRKLNALAAVHGCSMDVVGGLYLMSLFGHSVPAWMRYARIDQDTRSKSPVSMCGYEETGVKESGERENER